MSYINIINNHKNKINETLRRRVTLNMGLVTLSEEKTIGKKIKNKIVKEFPLENLMDEYSKIVTEKNNYDELFNQLGITK